MTVNIGNSGTLSRMECQLVRDFNASINVLMEQFERFWRSGTLSHPALSELIGVFENRGSLWRLKDVGHLLFSKTDDPAGQLLDRTLGAIYHETIKLMEATYQSQHYASACRTFMERSFTGRETVSEAESTARQELEQASERLLDVLEECADDLNYGIRRLNELLEIARPLLCICYAGKGSNQMLIRYLDGRRKIFERVMDGHYEEFINALGWEDESSPIGEHRFASRFAGGRECRNCPAAPEAEKQSIQNN
ncbi:MAG: hypothetical protein IJD04_06255 [Desulfovibrionaceae bacterium]|nr:hypothetical protein [Desulfovibrionaceae bacterium]